MTTPFFSRTVARGCALAPLTRRAAMAGIGASALARPASAQARPTEVRIAVVNDMSSAYSAAGGTGSVAAAAVAVEEFKAGGGSMNVELVTGDHRNRADLGLSIARQMYDGGVHAIFDLANSAVSLAVQGLARELGKVVVHVGSASADLYGRQCSPTGALWSYDTYALAHGLTREIVSEGGKTWFFLTADYTYGHALQGEVVAVLNESGGTVVGSASHPVDTSDFSSYLLTAQASRADVVALANAGNDTTNALKQAFEFGLPQSGQRLAVLMFHLVLVKALGPEVTQGLRYLEGYYWNQDDRSRDFAGRFAAKASGAMPSQTHAGVYSAVLHYLRSVEAAGSVDGLTAMRAMKQRPVDDAFARGARLRPDGRLMKDQLLVQVRKNRRSDPWDLLTVEKLIPAAEIIRPLADGGCTFLDG